MKQKAIIFLGLLFFLVLVVVCVVVHAPRIEKKVADQTRRRLEESGAEAITAEASGRRITLSGAVDSSVAVTEIVRMVQGVEGVRTVKSHLSYFSSPQDSSENEKVKILPVEEINLAEAMSKMHIRFADNSAVPEAGAVSIANQAVELWKSRDHLKLIVTGHTDSRGTESFNKDLSMRRAESVKALLIKAGMDQSRIIVEGYGEEQPVADNSTELGMQENRRVDFIVMDDYRCIF